MKNKNFKLSKWLRTRKLELWAEILLILITVMCAGNNGTTSFIISASALAVYSAVFAAALVRDMHSSAISEDSSFFSSIAKEFVIDLKKPVVIADTQSRIVWYNNTFNEELGTGGTLYEKLLHDIFGNSFNPHRLFKNDPKELVEYNRRYYVTTRHSVTSQGQTYCVIFWDDVSELTRTKALFDSKSTLVSYIMIDNFSEAMQFVQDKSRAASALIGEELEAWSASIGGILKEYDREKYILIFEKSQLKKLRENKFDILDKIRSLSIDGVDMAFTVSMGIACLDGVSLAEKEDASRGCLDHALQRGGDQVVVKEQDSSISYYGGTTQTVQKQTKVRSRVVANQLVQHINNHSNVIVMGHKYADHDCIASAVAVSRIAKHLGKQVNVVVNIHDHNLKPIFDSLRGHAEYTDLFIDRECAQELMNSDTLVVVCDVNNVNLFEVPEIYEAASDYIILDHHRKTAEFPREPLFSHIDPSVSSVSEIMSELLEEILAQGELPEVEANLLMSGIILDSKQYTKNTGMRTFGAAFYLRKEGADPGMVQHLFRTELEDFRKQSRFENNIEIYRDCVAISIYDGEDTENSDRIAMAKAADRLLSIEGISASFVLCTIGNEISISARSGGKTNVQRILELLGGGGHFDSAGAQIKDMSLDETVAKLKLAIDERLEQ